MYFSGIDKSFPEIWFALCVLNLLIGAMVSKYSVIATLYIMGEVNLSAGYLWVDSWCICVPKHRGLSALSFCFLSCPQLRYGQVMLW